MTAAARKADPVTATDTHMVLFPNGAVQALPHPFSGTIQLDVSTDVLVNGLGAATVNSVAVNQPPHIPIPPGTSFVTPPRNRGTIQSGFPSVLINGRAAARRGDAVRTCNDPVDLPAGSITGGSTNVSIG
jgi:uncharacterized Zn-binding protein involved in type VI secretion